MNMQQLLSTARALATMEEGSWSCYWSVTGIVGLRSGRGICGYQCVRCQCQGLSVEDDYHLAKKFARTWRCT